MNIQDSNTVRTAAELERKYNFSKLLGLEKNVQVNSGELIKVNNQLNNMLNSLIINLGDVLDSQTDISLWFYTGVPTTSNVPYTSWNTPTDHLGDFYYNQSTGYVYKYESTGWIIQNDQNLISALALTNADIDTQTDHERKVYFTQPVPAYSSGDWWILEDGTLKICQLGKGASEEYDSQDFVVSSKYTSTIATKQGDTITVLQGTVTEINDSYVKHTDIFTGTSTTIAGDKIKTGKITSNNFAIVNNNISTGTRLDLDNGKLETKNVTLDDDGLKLSNGAKVVGSNGLMNTYLEKKDGIVGFVLDYSSGSYIKNDVFIDVIVPNGLNITKATATLLHSPVHWFDGESIYQWGYSRNVKLYKCTNINSKIMSADFGGGVWSNDDTSTYEEISNAFGINGFTADIPSNNSHSLQSIESIDIKSNISSGLNRIKVSSDYTTPTTDSGAMSSSGGVQILLKIDGYMTYS